MNGRKVVFCGVLALSLGSVVPNVLAAGKSQGQNNGQPFKALQEQMDANLALIQANQGDISALQVQTSTLLDLFGDLGGQLQLLDGRVANNENELAAVNGELDSVSGSLTALFSDVSELASRHDQDLQEVRQQISDLSDVVNSNVQSINALNAQLVAKAAELSGAIADNALAVDGLAADLSLLNAQANMLSLQLISAQQSIASLEVRAQAHETALSDVLLRVATAEEALANHSHGEVDLTGVELSYESAGRDVHIFKTPTAAILADHTEFCESRGLVWWSPKSSVDAQLLLDNARAIDNYHTWVQVYGLVTTTGNPATMNGFAFAPDSPSCVSGSSEGWAGVRDWGCSLCDPDGSSNSSYAGLSHCWDTSHQYDWFACEAE